MADGEDDTLELTADLVVDQAEGDNTPANDDEQAKVEDEEIIIDDGGTPPPEQTDLVKHLRQVAKEQAAKIKELSKFAPQPVELGAKPDLWEDCEGDQDKFEAALLQWNNDKAKIESAKAQREAAQAKIDEQFEAEMELVRSAPERLKLADFDDAKAAVESVLSETQINAIVRATKDPGKVIYALGRHPSQLAALAQNQDLVKFISEVAVMETRITTRAKPAVDKPTTGGAAVAVSVDKQLEKLRKTAEETGNYSEYHAALRAQKKAA